MMQTKEELIERVIEILSKKSFTEQAKENLLGSIVFAYEHYNPSKYITKSRAEYIEEYLRVLENMKGYAVVDLNEINDSNEASTHFRKDILKSPTRSGNLDFINDKYVPTQNGEFYCSCKGFAWCREKMMFSLDEGDIMREWVTVHHEMTHLSEGANPFPIDISVPFSFELRKMLYEGRAATHESYISIDSSNVQVDSLENEDSKYEIASSHSYPLYGKLYQILQIIFGDEVLEQMSKNDSREVDMIQELERRYPSIPVLEVFSHLIYILSCKSKESKNVLMSSVQDYVMSHSKKIEWVQNRILLENQNLEFNRQSLDEEKSREEKIKKILEDPELLTEEYRNAKESARKDIEGLYSEGHYSEDEYRQELEALEQDGTLEYYQETQRQEVENIKYMRSRREVAIAECLANLQQLQNKRDKLKCNDFTFILERVCLKEPSLEVSFSFLEEMALKITQESGKGLTEQDKE